MRGTYTSRGLTRISRETEDLPWTASALSCAGDKLDQNLFDFAAACATIGDGYGDGEAGGNAGEHIRAEL